ncbi:MAG: TIGR03960 family B12-binding radical SAM protein [Deltaproteobacteria bacterium]|nr:TIGR03960 family B12-binding radical SAM protein [Deltaproteobacteria bacterium]
MAAINLAKVQKPSRYIGGEYGSFSKDPAAVDVHMALCFPDLYEIGMSSTGFQVLYTLANRRDDTFCERVFTPWTDLADQLFATGTPLTSLESKTPLRAFDVVLFSIQYELAITNLVYTLDLARIPRRAEARGEGDPIIVAGGHCASNPEPWAPFCDALVIGDGEDILQEILDLFAAMKGKSRREKLDALAKLKGVYRPADWTPKYEDGRFVGFDVAPGTEPAERRIVKDLDTVPTLSAPILPNTRLVHDRLAVEVMRGCTRGCRFCQPGMLTRPMRERSVDTLMKTVVDGLEQTGYDELTLLSLSSGDYSELSPLLGRLDEHLRDTPLSVSLPSLRAESITGEMMTRIAKVRKGGFTIAPEAGSERLRHVLNKPITDEQIFEACRKAVARGWSQVKLYFMVGLPSETDEDLQAIVDLCFAVLKIMDTGRRRGNVNVNVGTFVPKPFTPFQWERQITPDEAKRRLHFLVNKTRHSRVTVKGHDPKMSAIEGILGRSDRRMADAVELVVDRTGGFDGWTEHFSLDEWYRALRDTGLEPETILAGFEEDDALPWDGVDALIDKEFLLDERRVAYSRVLTEDCREGACTACGTCDDEIVNRLAKDFAPATTTPVTFVARNGLAKEPAKEPAPETIEDAAAPAEKPKPAKRGSHRPPERNQPGRDHCYRYRVRFAKVGDMRFLGHLELMPILHRALRRAGLRIAYSQGFHQQPRVAFGPPPAAGIQSEAEYFDIYLIDELSEDEFLKRLRDAAPERLPFLEVTRVAHTAPALFNAITGFSYRADLSPLFGADLLDAARVAAAVDAFNAADSLPVHIVRKGKERTIEGKDILAEVSFDGANLLSLELRQTDTGSLKPVQALAALLELDEEAVLSVDLTKTATHFVDGDFSPAADASDEAVTSPSAP